MQSFRQLAKRARRNCVNRFKAMSPNDYLADIGWPFVGTFLSTDEAARVLTTKLRHERMRGQRKHWSYDPNRLIALQERVVAARYMRRFAKRLWLDERAANRKAA